LKAYKKAANILETLIDKNPKDIDSYRNLHVCYEEMGTSEKILPLVKGNYASIKETLNEYEKKAFLDYLSELEGDL
jgi:hypothetical protein